MSGAPPHCAVTPLHLTKNPFAGRPPHLCGVALEGRVCVRQAGSRSAVTNTIIGIGLELVFIRWMCYNSSMKEARAERKPYPTDLTDDQWREIEPLYSGMRNRKWSKRELTNAVLYIVKTGCQWRQLPHDFPPYQTVYSFFSRGAKSGLWEKILAHLVEKTRKDAGKSAEPHYALIDSQSVKTVADNEERGIDGGKKQKGANVMPS